MIIPMLCVTIFVILVVWFLLPRVARLMIHTPTAISIFVCLSMVQRSEERRVGKECRSRWPTYNNKKKTAARPTTPTPSLVVTKLFWQVLKTRDRQNEDLSCW